MEAAQIALEALETGQAGSQALVQVAGGIFLRALMQDASQLIINVGGNVLVEKSRAEVLDQIKNQRNALSHMKLELESQQARLLDQARQLQQEFEHRTKDHV